MSTNLWIAYTPNGTEFFPTEEEAKGYLKEVLVSDGMWDEEYIPRSWIGKITHKPQLKVLDRKEDHKCIYPDRACSFRDEDGICTESPHDDAYVTNGAWIDGCMEVEPWEHSSEFDNVAELEFVDAEVEE